MHVILIIGAAQALFFSILLFNKKERKLHDKVLAGWLVVFAVHLSFAYWLFLKKPTYVNYVGYDAGILVLYYSFMYLYARSIISQEESVGWKWLLHLIPCVLVYVTMFPFIRLSMQEKFDLFQHNLSPMLFISLFFAVLFSSGYLIMIFRLVNSHGRNIKRSFSYDENINLLWLKKLAILLAGIWIFFTAAIIYVYYLKLVNTNGTLQLYSSLDFVGYGLFTLFVYLLGFFGYRQGNVFVHQPVLSYTASTDKKSQKKGSTSESVAESESAEKEFISLLADYMENEKPYLNSTLSLYQLARDLNVTSHYLSNILNNQLQKNFYEFVNHYRVAEVKRRIVSDQNAKYTILAIALDCGFNSKATFNRIFKNYTGLTPSEFQQEFTHGR